MTDRTKSTWSKPELIVLVRGRPEESVLANCKSDLTAGSTGDRNNNCGVFFMQDCFFCEIQAGS